MKIAVSAKGTTLDDEVDLRFGRASVFLLVDTETGRFEVVENTQNLEAAQGAGIQSAATVAEHGAEAVISGHCGPKAFRTLSAAGIKVAVGTTGTVREALDQFASGKLEIVESADVEGHWI